MIPEPRQAYFDILEARMTALERDNADMKRALDLLDKEWRAKIAPAAKGAAGTMAVYEEGWATPRIDAVNVRKEPRVDPSTKAYELPVGEWRKVVGGIIVGDYIWFTLEDGNYVREDVVRISHDAPEHIPPSLPVPSVAVLNAAYWPAPCRGTITNTHHNERHHDGVDIACAIGTPVTAGPNGGYVSKAYVCRHCKPNGDGIASLNDASKGYGYGSHVVIRYAYDLLPQRIQAMIPHGAFLFAMHAHLSAVNVSQGQTLEPYQVIGAVGATGNTYGANPWHLHFALHWSEDENADFYSIRANAIDPLLLIRGN